MPNMGDILQTLVDEISWTFSSKDFTDKENGNFWSLLYPFPMAIIILLVRYLLFRYCYVPWGIYLGVKTTRGKRAPPNPVLEDAHMKWKDMPGSKIAALAKQVDMSERQVERWMRQRRAQNRPSPLIKFSESCWKFTYYTTSSLYGLVVLWNKPWLWDIKHCWTDYLNQAVTNDIWWYYMVSLAFYWSLFFGQFFIDVRRTDFWQMFVHHNATILLIIFTWLGGGTRIGSLALIVHDCGDIFLELPKIAKYANFHRACNVFYCVFIVVWIVTRLGLFPLWIVKHSIFDLAKVMDFKAYYICNALALTLIGLHCFWTYLIFKIMVVAVRTGKVEKDVRSSSEEKSE